MTRPRTTHLRVRWDIIGLVGAMLGFAGFAAHYAFVTAPLLPNDEHAHVGYGYAIAEGRLPEVDSWITFPRDATHMARQIEAGPDDRYRQVWVAHHPPLYYVALAPVLVATDAVGHANLGILAGRLLNIAFATAAIGVTYLLAVEVSGGSRRVGLTAAGLAAFVVHAQYTFSHAYNDGLALLTTTLMLWTAARCLRRACPPRGLLVLSLVIAAAAATRASGLILGVFVAVMVLAVRTKLDAGRVPRPIRQGLLRATTLALPTAVLAGWFYVRNMVLYGDVTASSYQLERFGRGPRERPLLDVIFNGEVWSNLYDHTIGHTYLVVAPVHVSEPAFVIWRVVGLMALAGLVVALVNGRTRDRDADGRPTVLSRPGVAVLLIAATLACAMFAQHVAGGGSPWPRYVLPALGSLAALAALGLNQVLPRLLPLLAVAGAAATTWALAAPTEVRLAAAPSTAGDISLGLAVLGSGLACVALGVDRLRPGPAVPHHDPLSRSHGRDGDDQRGHGDPLARQRHPGDDGPQPGDEHAAEASPVDALHGADSSERHRP